MTVKTGDSHKKRDSHRFLVKVKLIAMQWNAEVQHRFKVMISKIPVFHRGITENAVTKRAEEISRLRNAPQVEEQDVIAAFFSDVPSPFYSMMVRLMEHTGFDYKKYGYPKAQIDTNEKPNYPE